METILSMTKKLLKYQFLSVAQERIEDVKIAYAKKYTTLLAAKSDSGLSSKTITKFLRGERMQRQTFLRLCVLLRIPPLAIAGLEPLQSEPPSPIEEGAIDLNIEEGAK
jgi:hypothetical protein